MVTLGLWLGLFLVYQVTTLVTSHQHGDNKVSDQVINTFDKLIHHKHHNNVYKHNDFKKIGKFKQSTIGSSRHTSKTSQQSNKELQYPKEVQPVNNNIVKEFETFTKHKHIDQHKNIERRSQNDSDDKIAQLHNLILSTTEKQLITKKPTESQNKTVVKDNLMETSTEKINNTHHIISDDDEPKPLGLTSNNKKRGILQQLPDNDGNFVYGVIGVAVGCIVVVVGLGYLLHRPACNRSCTPFSDSSPTFQSAKLAFSSSSPEEKMSNSSKFTKPSSQKENKSSSKDSGSRSFKFKENTDNNNYQGHLYNYKGTMRQESLIDIDGPEEDDDDMIYECPGLAPHGEMEVTNPFFLQKDFNMNTEEENKCQTVTTTASIHPCPISSASNIRHGSIFRNTQPGQQ